MKYIIRIILILIVSMILAVVGFFLYQEYTFLHFVEPIKQEYVGKVISTQKMKVKKFNCKYFFFIESETPLDYKLSLIDTRKAANFLSQRISGEDDPFEYIELYKDGDKNPIVIINEFNYKVFGGNFSGNFPEGKHKYKITYWFGNRELSRGDYIIKYKIKENDFFEINKNSKLVIQNIFDLGC